MFSQVPYNLLWFLSLVFATLLFTEAATYFLDLNQLLYKNLSEQLTVKQIESYFETKTRWSWVKYVLFPLMLFLKTTVMAWILAIGGFFYQLRLSHGDYWEIVLKAEFVFVFAALVKILWFLFIQPDFSLEEVQQFVPFSLANILDTSAIPAWGLYPLQLVNFFEICYWVLLAVLLNQEANTKKGFQIVAASYGPALFIWMVFIMFLTLNLS